MATLVDEETGVRVEIDEARIHEITVKLWQEVEREVRWKAGRRLRAELIGVLV